MCAKTDMTWVCLTEKMSRIGHWKLVLNWIQFQSSPPCCKHCVCCTCVLTACTVCGLEQDLCFFVVIKFEHDLHWTVTALWRLHSFKRIFANALGCCGHHILGRRQPCQHHNHPPSAPVWASARPVAQSGSAPCPAVVSYRLQQPVFLLLCKHSIKSCILVIWLFFISCIRFTNISVNTDQDFMSNKHPKTFCWFITVLVNLINEFSSSVSSSFLIDVADRRQIPPLNCIFKVCTLPVTFQLLPFKIIW